jgi:MFS family permease
MTSVGESAQQQADAMAAAATSEDDQAPDTQDAAMSVPLGRNQAFMLLWIGAGIANLGSRVSAIAYTLLVFWTTGSATDASYVTSAALLPNLFMQLPAGALVDHWNRRVVMICCDVGRIVAVGSVVAAVFLGHVWLPQLIAVAFVESSLTAVYLLAERAAVFTVVHETQIGPAMSRNEARNQASGLLGQPFGTFLFAAVRWVPFVFTVFAHAVSLATLLFIKRDLRPGRDGRKRSPLAEISEGFKFVLGQLYLKRALFLIAASNILFQILALGLIVIVKHHGGSATTIGLVIGASGVGGMFGALQSSFYIKRFGIRRIIMGVNILWSGLMTAIAFTHAPLVLAAIFTAMIYAAGVSNVAGIVYTMKTTPGSMQGRVGSIANLMTSGGNALGALLAGVLLDHYGTKATMLSVGAIMTALAVLSLFWFGGRKAAALERELNLR